MGFFGGGFSNSGVIISSYIRSGNKKREEGGSYEEWDYEDHEDYRKKRK